MWIGDSGASSHIMNLLQGMTNLKDVNNFVTFGDSKKLKIMKTGIKQGVVVQKDGTMKLIEIKNVKYVPDM